MKNYKSIVIFDTETTGLDYKKNQIIELAAIKITVLDNGNYRKEKELDLFCSLPEGQRIPAKIVELTGITDQMLEDEGIPSSELAEEFLALAEGPTLLIAHNAQFDALFLLELVKGYDIPKFDYLDTLTVYKDRRAYPHRLANAIKAYGLEGKVVNSHRAIDDVIALWEVVKAMGRERRDLMSYINIFGYNAKYGVQGVKLPGIQYKAHGFNDYMVNEDATLPALLQKEQGGSAQMQFDI